MQSKRADAPIALTLEVTGVGDDDGAGLFECVECGGHGWCGRGGGGCCPKERRPRAGKVGWARG